MCGRRLAPPALSPRPSTRQLSHSGIAEVARSWERFQRQRSRRHATRGNAMRARWPHSGSKVRRILPVLRHASAASPSLRMSRLRRCRRHPIGAESIPCFRPFIIRPAASRGLARMDCVGSLFLRLGRHRGPFPRLSGETYGRCRPPETVAPGFFPRALTRAPRGALRFKKARRSGPALALRPLVRRAAAAPIGVRHREGNGPLGVHRRRDPCLQLDMSPSSRAAATRAS